MPLTSLPFAKGLANFLCAALACGQVDASDRSKELSPKSRPPHRKTGFRECQSSAFSLFVAPGGWSCPWEASASPTPTPPIPIPKSTAATEAAQPQQRGGYAGLIPFLSLNGPWKQAVQSLRCRPQLGGGRTPLAESADGPVNSSCPGSFPLLPPPSSCQGGRAQTQPPAAGCSGRARELPGLIPEMPPAT